MGECYVVKVMTVECRRSVTVEATHLRTFVDVNCLFVCLFVCLSVCLFVCLSVCLSVLK